MRIELKYMEHSAAQEEAERQSLQEIKANKQKKRHLMCLIMLVCLVAVNALYGLCTLKHYTPTWKVIVSDNIICKLWKKYPAKSSQPKNGLINGIMFSKDNPLALIDNELVHQGDVIDGVKVVQIGPRAIQFEKSGKVWFQGVFEKPDSAW